jgi:hypothetical protein
MRDLSFCRSAFSLVRTCKNSRSLLLLCVLWSEHHLSDHRIPVQVELPLGEGGPRSHNVRARCLRCRTTEMLSLDMSYRTYFCEVSENRTGESLAVAALMLKQERSADRAGSGTMEAFLLRRGQTTTFQERLDITLPCNRWTVRLRDCSDARLAPSGWCASLNLTRCEEALRNRAENVSVHRRSINRNGIL